MPYMAGRSTIFRWFRQSWPGRCPSISSNRKRISECKCRSASRRLEAPAAATLAALFSSSSSSAKPWRTSMGCRRSCWPGMEFLMSKWWGSCSQKVIIQYHSWFIVIIDTMMCSLLFENRSVWIINTASKAVVVWGSARWGLLVIVTNRHRDCWHVRTLKWALSKTVIPFSCLVDRCLHNCHNTQQTAVV